MVRNEDIREWSIVQGPKMRPTHLYQMRVTIADSGHHNKGSCALHFMALQQTHHVSVLGINSGACSSRRRSLLRGATTRPRPLAWQCRSLIAPRSSLFRRSQWSLVRGQGRTDFVEAPPPPLRRPIQKHAGCSSSLPKNCLALPKSCQDISVLFG